MIFPSHIIQKFCLHILYVSLVVCSCSAIGQEREGDNTLVTLSFPDERSLGVVYHVPKHQFDEDENVWMVGNEFSRIGDAQGEVQVPADSWIRLELSADGCRDLSALSSLPEKHIHSIYIYGSEIEDSQLVHIGSLTKLRSLYLYGCPLTDEGIVHLANLNELRAFLFSPHGHEGDGLGISDKGLEVIGRLPKLRAFYLQGQNPITDESLLTLAGNDSIEILGLAGTQVSDDGLDALLMMPNLRKLDFGSSRNGAPIGDKGMETLGLLTKVTDLNLSGTNVTDNGLAELSGLTNLERLSLDYTEVTDEGLQHLLQMSKLKQLRFYRENKSLGDEAALHLSELKNLEQITAHWNLSSDGLRHLSMLPRLSSVDLSRPLTDDDLKIVADMKGLKRLKLQNCEVTDEGIRHIQSMDQLEYLMLNGTQATPQVLEILAGMQSLSGLFLDLGKHGPQRPGPAWQKLSDLSNLESLSVFGLLLLDEDYEVIAKLNQLKRLEISTQMLVTDALVDALVQIPTLESFSLRDSTICQWNDESVRRLSQLHNLEYLSLTCPVTDRGLMHLSTLPSLRSLTVESHHATDEGLAALQAACPSLQRARLRLPRRNTAMTINDAGIIQYGLSESRAPFDEMLGEPAARLTVKNAVNVPGGALDIDLVRGKTALLVFCDVRLPRMVQQVDLFKQLREKHNQELEIIFVQNSRAETALQPFVEDQEIDWPCAVDLDLQTARDWLVERRSSAYFLIDSEGNVQMADFFEGDVQRAVDHVLRNDPRNK